MPLAQILTEAPVGVWGMVIIILLQLSQFIFAWKKDMRSSESVKKEDMTTLRNELLDEVQQVTDDVKDLRESFDTKMESLRKENKDSRTELYSRLNSDSNKIATLTEGVDTLKQTVTALGNKMDVQRSRPA